MGKAEGKKGRAWALAGIALLVSGFLLCRYALIGLHGMKQWAELLALAGAAVLGIAVLARKRRLALSVGAGYLIGFLWGQPFRTYGVDTGGGSTSNQWIIWTVTFILCMAAGLFWDLAGGRAGTKSVNLEAVLAVGITSVALGLLIRSNMYIPGYFAQGVPTSGTVSGVSMGIAGAGAAHLIGSAVLWAFKRRDRRAE